MSAAAALLPSVDSASTSSPAVPGTAPATVSSAPAAAITTRPSRARGHADHGWLNSYHTFSFASYHDPKFEQFHSLRVINEDRVSPSRGFPTHGHSDAEIFSYVVRGAILHKDSLGNTETLPRGYVQFTSAGSGIRHSEFNASPTDYLHFLQIWVTPSKRGLKPGYQTMSWDDKDKENKLALIIAPPGVDQKEGKHITINQDLKMLASILEPGKSVTYTFPAGRVGYLHIIMDTTSMTTEAGKSGAVVNGVALSQGDGAFINPTTPDTPSSVTITGTGTGAELLLFDIKRQL